MVHTIDHTPVIVLNELSISFSICIRRFRRYDLRVNLYTRIFDYLWTPFRLIAKALIEFRSVQRSRFPPYVLGACVGRWPERVSEPNEVDDVVG